MSETTAPNLSPRRIELPGASQPDFVAASPHQIARLAYLGVAVQEPLSSYEANRIIDQTNNDPAYEERIQAWESEKQALHPELFRVPPRFAGLSIPTVPAHAPAPNASPSAYAPISEPAIPGFVPPDRRAALPPAPSASPAKFFLLAAAVAMVAVFGGAGWFVWKSPWLLQVLPKPSVLGVSVLPGGSSAAPARPTAPASPVTQSAATASALPPDDLARRVAASQQLAVARYPALGTAGSEINSRFVFRYKRLLADRSERLRDPNWPLLLADECAAASGMKVPSSTAKSTASGSRVSSSPLVLSGRR